MMDMPDQVPPATKPYVSQGNLALTVYVLYLVGFVTGFTALIGVIIAHVKAPLSDDSLRGHFRFQIRTFWIGLLYLVVGWLLSYLIIGIPLLIWWFVWTVIRIIKGMLLLNDGKPIPKPSSWLFG